MGAIENLDWRLQYFDPMKAFADEAIGAARFASFKSILEFGCGNRGGMIDLTAFRIKRLTASI